MFWAFLGNYSDAAALGDTRPRFTARGLHVSYDDTACTLKLFFGRFDSCDLSGLTLSLFFGGFGGSGGLGRLRVDGERQERPLLGFMLLPAHIAAPVVVHDPHGAAAGSLAAHEMHGGAGGRGQPAALLGPSLQRAAVLETSWAGGERSGWGTWLFSGFGRERHSTVGEVSFAVRTIPSYQASIGT